MYTYLVFIINWLKKYAYYQTITQYVLAGVAVLCCLLTITTAFEYKLISKFQDIHTGEPCIPMNGNASCVLFTRAENISFEDYMELYPTITADVNRNGTFDIIESSFDTCLRVCIHYFFVTTIIYILIDVKIVAYRCVTFECPIWVTTKTTKTYSTCSPRCLAPLFRLYCWRRSTASSFELFISRIACDIRWPTLDRFVGHHYICLWYYIELYWFD